MQKNTEIPLLLRTLRGETTPRPPVWMMRQAGRYLSEYRALKELHGFIGLCSSAELAFEISMQPMRIVKPDAAIVFADILLPAEALGIQVEFSPGPKILNPIKTADDAKNIKYSKLGKSTEATCKTISLLKSELSTNENKAVLGFAGAPWTMACYLLAQGLFKHFEGTLVFARESENAFTHLLDNLTILTCEYLQAQIESGADAVQLFDTWAGSLSLSDYEKYALPHTQRILSHIANLGVPTILYINNTNHLLPALNHAGATAISIDSRTSLKSAREILNQNIIIQGNFDPTHLYGQPSQIEREAREMLQSLKDCNTGYIANLGHGILPTTPRENAACFIDTVKSWK